MVESDTIAEGRAAWQRIRKSWDDWIKIGKALLEGQVECMRIASVNAPVGGKYLKVRSTWLAANGFDGMNREDRSYALDLAEHPAIHQWLESLPEQKRRRLRHPQSIVREWRVSQGYSKPRKPRETEKVEAVAEIEAPTPPRQAAKGKAYRPTGSRPCQDLIRRFWLPLAESGSADYAILATIAAQVHLDMLRDDEERPARPAPALEPMHA